MSIVFKVPGKVKGKARARTYFDSRAGRYRSITPAGTVEYENRVRLAWDQMKHPGWFDDQALSVLIVAYYEIPKTTSRKDRERIATGKLHPTKKPDADNIAKSVCDALNHIAYHDDSQIVMLVVTKRYTDGAPHVLVSIDDVTEPIYRKEEDNEQGDPV